MDDPKDKDKGDKAAVAAADTYISPKGNVVTRDQWLLSAKNGLPFTDMKTMGDWMDTWARPVKPEFEASPYYRAYGSNDNINGADVQLVHSALGDQPGVLELLNRNIANPGEVPMYSAQDSDVIKQLISKSKGMYNSK